MNIGSYSFEEYKCLVESFHGNLSPGLIIGGYMVDLALRHLPEGESFDDICETTVCLPDAIQLLTRCTVGNGRLNIIDVGRMAVTLYENNRGEGVRVYLDHVKLKPWPAVEQWYLKQTEDHDIDLLIEHVKQAGHRILSIQFKRVDPLIIRRQPMGTVADCRICGEIYPLKDGDRCRGCCGELPYIEITAQPSFIKVASQPMTYVKSSHAFNDSSLVLNKTYLSFDTTEKP